MRRLWIALLSIALCAPSPALGEEITHNWPLDAKRIEAALAGLGLPVGPVDGTWDFDTARATCVWRELTGRPVLRSWPVVAERRELKATKALTVPRYMRVGININRQCQVAVWVTSELVEDTRTAIETTTGVAYSWTDFRFVPMVHRVMPVSTGMAGYETVPGDHVVAWTVNRWWQSTIYADGRMYRPMFFHRGQALHGSSSDSLVHTYPASHGCVRMLHADIDALWDEGFGRGDHVIIYGDWKG